MNLFWKRKRKWMVVALCAVLLLSSASGAFAFGKGAQGPDVYAVQGMLKSLGYFTGTITGYYGTQTEAAVKRFQKAYGLSVTGAVDDKTLQSILWAYGNLKIPKKPAPPTPKTPPSVPGLNDEEQQMFELVNGARKQAGLPPLMANLELSRVARIKSQEMVDKQYFSHTSPTYGSPFEMMKKFGITYTSAAENIACDQNVTSAHKALMNSAGHRANILGKAYTEIGIGIVNGGPCGKIFTQMFIGK